MIDAIVCGGLATSDRLDDPESNLARRLLEHTLAPLAAPRMRLAAASLVELGRKAYTALVRDHPADAKILLLAHDLLLPTSTGIAALAAALDAGLPAAAACDASACAGADYLTLRGFERFAESAASLPARPAESFRPPLMAMVRLTALADEAWLFAPRLGNAWVHDFSGYRAQRREEMLGLLPPTCASLLDVGGGAGSFLAAVKQRWPACRTALVEMSPAACEEARFVVDRVWQGDFLRIDLDAHFDCISFLDVLEHVPEPAALLAKARAHLAPQGSIIASVPNVGHWSVVADLLEGRWDYAPAGIHCITHLRFFTRKGVEELFAGNDFVIEAWQAATLSPPAWFAPDRLAPPLVIDRESLATVAWQLRARPR